MTIVFNEVRMYNQAFIAVAKPLGDQAIIRKKWKGNVKGDIDSVIKGITHAINASQVDKAMKSAIVALAPRAPAPAGT